MPLSTSRLWEEYQAQRALHQTLRQTRLANLAITKAQHVAAAKASARAKRSVIKMTLKGAAKRLAYAAVQSELSQTLRALSVRIGDERRSLYGGTRRLSWIDWLQGQAAKGREDALEALRAAASRSGMPHTISGPDRTFATRLDSEAQLTKQGTVIQRVGDYEIRDTGEGLNVATNASDDALAEMLRRAKDRYERGLTANGPRDFQLRIARVAGVNHLAVSFEDPELEKARQVALVETPAPVNKSALDYITERNSKRAWLSDIPFHRLWQPADAGQLRFVGLRESAQQSLLLLSKENETLVLPITEQQRQHLAQQQRGIAVTISQAIAIHAQSQTQER